MHFMVSQFETKRVNATYHKIKRNCFFKQIIFINYECLADGDQYYDFS